MSVHVRLWVEISHQPAHCAGGWAYVLAEGARPRLAVQGAAGGDRGALPARIALAGLAHALGATLKGAEVEVISASPAVLALGQAIAQAASPEEDLDLWAPIAAAVGSRTVRFRTAATAPRTPGVFAQAWAELARDKAKTRPFQATIPKSNLEKANVPG